MSAADRLTDTPAPLDDASLSRLFATFEPHPSILLAVSGGPDSTALMLLAHRWRQARGEGPVLYAASVDHGLRAEARAEAEAAGRIAAALGIGHAVLEWRGAKPSAGVQEAAREARYALLLDHARSLGASALATAHTRDDQAETVLFRLSRGSGIAGLAGIPAEREAGGIALLRPLLDMPKATLVAVCMEAGAAVADDPSNRDPRFTRARLRRLMPELAREGLDAARLALFARRMARAEAALASAADAAFDALARPAPPEGAGIDLPAAGLLALPDEVALRVLGLAVARAGGDGPAELGKLEALFEALRGACGGAGAAWSFPGRTLAGASIRADRGVVRVRPAPPRRVRGV